MRTGRFLCLDGVDGAGKSTQLTRLESWLRDRGRDVVVCRDPGGTPAGEALRRIILDPELPLDPLTELLLYTASRAELVQRIIRPALADGRTVLVDRFVLSTIVYQGHGNGHSRETILRLHQLANDGLMPDWTGVLDVPLEVSVARRCDRADRIESRPQDYQGRVREGFRAEAAALGSAATLIDATPSADLVHAAITREVSRVLSER
jgi:dTMP kinase